jgi:hypothetical protein
MPTLVEKLQFDAMDPNVRVSDLLRRVKFTAVQLGLGNVEDWVERELPRLTICPAPQRALWRTRSFCPHMMPHQRGRFTNETRSQHQSARISRQDDP